MTTFILKMFDNNPVVRLIRPPLTKLSNVEMPMYNLVFCLTRSISAKISGTPAPACANFAA